MTERALRQALAKKTDESRPEVISIRKTRFSTEVRLGINGFNQSISSWAITRVRNRSFSPKILLISLDGIPQGFLDQNHHSEMIVVLGLPEIHLRAWNPSRGTPG